MGLWLVGYSALHLHSVSAVAWKGHASISTYCYSQHGAFQLGSLPALTRPRYVQWNLYKGGNGILAILEDGLILGAFY